jgi:hypothetical protein
LGQVVDRLEAFHKSPQGSPLKIESGLIVFSGKEAKNALEFGPFKPDAYRNWLKQFSNPRESTPLGAAVALAGEKVLGSSLPRKHILVITDGQNTAGRDPVATIGALQRRAARLNSAVLIHFVAFDVDSNVFAGVKKLGATVVGAADEKELNAQLEFILEEKILLEAETPARKSEKPNK